MELEINRVYNMDCLDLMSEMEKQGIVADWLITDPPLWNKHRKDVFYSKWCCKMW